MPYTTLISAEDLKGHLNDPNWVLIDCRFSLADTEQGRRAFEESHLPGAQYAHLDNDLSGPIIPGQTSRHPLPNIAAFVQRLSEWGIDETVQVVAYDDGGGAIASRLWWMLRWLGHEAVAVLDGGWKEWQQADYPTQQEVDTRPGHTFTPQPRSEMLVSAGDVLQLHTDPAYRLLDARSADRFRGENETLDPVAGHIPGATSVPYAENLTAEGKFRSVEALRQRFDSLLGETPTDQAIHYCGSGVTAAHNVLAMAHAGLRAPNSTPGRGASGLLPHKQKDWWKSAINAYHSAESSNLAPRPAPA